MESKKEFDSQKHITYINDFEQILAYKEYYASILQSWKEKQKELEATCEHSLIIRLGAEKLYCLTCNKLVAENEIDLSVSEIIEVEGISNPDILNAKENGEYILVTRAKQKLMELANMPFDLDMTVIKSDILEDLICFEDELIYYKFYPRARKKNEKRNKSRKI